MIQSNLQFIEYVISINDTEQQFGAVSFDDSHLDFSVGLETKSCQLNFRSLPENETAIDFANKFSPNLHVRQDEGKNELHVDVHFVDFNGFLAISEFELTLCVSDEELLRLKATIVKNKAEKFKFLIFPKVEFFQEINRVKLGKNGKSMSSKFDYAIQYEF